MNVQCAHCHCGGFASRLCSGKSYEIYFFYIHIYVSNYISLNCKVPPENIKTGPKSLLVTLLVILLELKYINLRYTQLVRNRRDVRPFHTTNFHGKFQA